MRPKTRLIAVLGWLLLLAGAATAAEKKTDVQKARAHYKAGEAFFAAGLWDRAVDEYQAAYTLVPRPQLLFNLGSAYRRKAETTGAADDLRAAIDHYQRYLQAEPKGQGATDAAAYVTALGPQLAEAERVEALRPKPPERPPSEPPPAVTPTPPVVPAPVLPAPLAVADRPSGRGRTWRIAGWTSAGAGVALMGAGAYFGFKARSASQDLQALQAEDRWDQSLYDSGRRSQRAMAALLGVGGVAVVGGAVMVFVLGRDRRSEPRIAVVPAAGGLGIQGKF